MTIGVTGAPAGSILVGTSPLTKGSIIRILHEELPIKKQTDKLKVNNQVKASWLAKMDPRNRVKHLKSIAENNDYSIGHGKGKSIEIVQLGPVISEKIDVNNAIGRTFTTKEFEDMFPRAAGSKARRHTLVLIKEFWKVSENFELANSFGGPVIDIITGELKNRSDKKCFVYGGFPLKYTKVKAKWEYSGVGKVAIEIPSSGNRSAISLIDKPVSNKYFKQFTPAALKSLIQKIIRYRPHKVEMIDGKQYVAEDVLLTAMALLADHPGSFVPDIQRYVTGMESFMKRLGIILYEDSYGTPEQLVSLFGGALLSQLNRRWKPSSDCLRLWLDWGVKALKEPRHCVCEIERGVSAKPDVIKLGQSKLQTASAILEVLKAFPTDHGLARAWANGWGKMTKSDYRPKLMPIGHCVDHHWAPGLVYLLPMDGFKSHAKAIEHIWNRSSKINSRTSKDIPCKMVARAQLEFLQDMHPFVNKRKVVGHVRMQSQYDDSWLAGIVGPINVKPRSEPNMIVTLNPKEPMDLVAIKRPARGETKPLTPEQRNKGVKAAQDVLSKGVKTSFGVVRLVGNKYTVNGVEWDKFKKQIEKIPVHEELNGVGSGVVSTKKKLDFGFDINTLRRVLMYISHFRNRFELKRVSRDGKGGSVLDNSTYRYFQKLAMWMPGAVEQHYPGRYRVARIELLIYVRQWLESYIADKSGLEYKRWSFAKDERKLWEHQASIVNSLLESQVRGSFVWAPVGSGKTKVVLTYMSRLNDLGKLPPYVLYTLPKSAIESVKKEISKFGLKSVVVSPLKTSKLSTPQKHCINLIEHDHLRRFEDLCAHGSKALLVVDEVHKTLNDSLRTMAAVELGHCAVKFVVMTGTPIIDSNTHKLIPWLEQIVDFKVDDHNFWVAANGMISKTFNTGIETAHHNYKVDVDEEYYDNVPKAFGGNNTNPSSSNWTRAMNLCYKACNTAMINKVRELVAKDRGVMLVCKDNKHREYMAGRLNGLRVHVMIQPIVYDYDSNNKYDVVLVTVKQAEGYTLTRLTAMVTCVYPSNDATRQQLEGRINRISQRAKKVDYYTYHAGMLSNLYEVHANARAITDALKGYAKVIKF